MSMGGGSSTYVPPDNSVYLEQMKEEERAKNKAEDAATQAADLAQRQQTFSTKLEQALTGAQSSARQRVADRGLNYDDYGDRITQAITRQQGLVPDLDPNPGQYFTDAVIDNALNDAQTGKRQQFTRQVNDAFKPNAADTLFSDTADDPFIDAIIGRQKGEAVTSLNAAKARGNLDDTGFDAAMSRLGEMERGARSTANTLGGTVIQGDRKAVNDIGNEARAAAGSYNLGDSFNLGDYTSRYDTTAHDLTGRLEGDVNNALAGQQFFDLADILTRGGIAQGAVNPSFANIGAGSPDATRDARRGIGGIGTF